jgi:hypothetical protein
MRFKARASWHPILELGTTIGVDSAAFRIDNFDQREEYMAIPFTHRPLSTRNAFMRHSVFGLLGSLLSIFSLAIQSAQPLIISEFLASNQSGLQDEDGETSDWIELWNPSDQAVSTEGFYLTDDIENPTKWALPNSSIPENGFQIIFASGKDRTSSPRALHTNFRLSRQPGGFLALTHTSPQGLEVLSQFTQYPKQISDVSYGTPEQNLTTAVYFQEPSPGAQNRTNSTRGFVADTQFSHRRGFYDRPIEVTITSATPGATLIYTIDGSLPTTRNGNRIPPSNGESPASHALSVAGTTTLRAMAILDGFEPTNVDTQTYLFPEQILQQNDDFHAIGSTASWGHAGPDWEMDPSIVNHTNPEIKPEPIDLLRLATISLGLDFEEFFGRNGIYIAGQSVEKATSIEFLDPILDSDQNVETTKTFQTDGTVQIVGGSSPNRWKSDKLSLRLKFDQDLEFPVFGRQAVDRFDTLVLDARLNNVWHYGGGVEAVGQRNRAQYVRDQFTANLHNQLGGHSPHGRHVHLYLNGIYWGIHTLHERPDDNFAASYLGGDNSDYDSIKHRPNDVLQGSSANYNRLHTLADQNLSDAEGFQSIASILDLQAFTSYMLVNYYVGNTDWAHHNWYASFNRVDPNGRWRFHSWDAEKGLHHVNDDRTGRNDNGAPTNLQHDLVRNPEYKIQFADQAYQALVYGPLSPESTRESYLAVSAPIELPVRVESARWGDNQRATAFNRLDWLETRNQLLGESTRTSSDLYNYFSRRSQIVLEQFRKRGWLPSIAPPTFNQHGGNVPIGFKVTIQKQDNGTIYFTTDRTDPRVPGVLGEQSTTELISVGALKHATMPSNSSDQQDWFKHSFDDTSWPKGRRGAGYENSNGYQDLIDPNFDFKEKISSSENESIYMRIPFQLSEALDFDQLTLLLRYDDGFIAYLNGTEVARANSPGTAGRPQAWDASASATHSDGEAVTFIPFDISPNIELLRPGTNLLAIQGLNSGTSSSDFIIWPTLEAAKTAGGAPSGISPSAITYEGTFPVNQPTRIRARILSGRNWSPILQAAFLPSTQLPNASNLTISKIHYRPAAPSSEETEAGFTRRADFEFIELTNLSDTFVNLSRAHFSAGIRFEFKDTLPQLAPRESLIVAANPSAYRFRYKTDDNVFGPFRFGSRLANGGETIALKNPAGLTILAVTYQDSEPWPAQADGGGATLALIEPRPNLDLNEAGLWQAVPIDLPDVPSAESDPFVIWQSKHFTSDEILTTSISGANDDPDQDSIDNLREFFHGTNPRSKNPPTGQLELRQSNHISPDSLTLQFTHSEAISPQQWVIETSENLRDWIPLNAADLIDAFDNPDQTRTIRIPIETRQDQHYYRLAITITPHL